MVMAAFDRPMDGGIVGGASGRAMPVGALPSRRVVVLEQIAERYGELTDPLADGALPGDGLMAGVLRMPRTYTATVREFERLVVLLRAEDRVLWGHLDGWWLSAVTRTVFHCPRCGICHQSEHRHENRRSGRMSTVKCKRVVQWRRRQGAREGEARRAIEWVAAAWSLGSEPMLPDELRVVG
jgi:hypothetical protein